jgi:hypothetical protein
VRNLFIANQNEEHVRPRTGRATRFVVQSIGYRDDQWLDAAGSAVTSTGRVTERIRRPDYGTLLIELSVDDPKAYTKPWTVTLKQEAVVDTELIEAICAENEKDVQHLKAIPR